jgi:phosphofructokinase-like protein
MRVGILTAGGDCPGINAVIRAAGRKLMAEGHVPVGIRCGWRGLAERDYLPLEDETLSGILTLGGTILSTSNFHPVREQGGLDKVRQAVEEDKIDALISIGGEHTMMINRQVMDEIDLPIVSVPKTIDNDVMGTDYTFGFHTAVQVATDAIDRLHSTAQSHDRVMVLEVMGRNSGWIAVFAGLAGGADAIVIPELELTVEEITKGIEHRHQHGKNFSIIVAAEGAELVLESGERRAVRDSDELDTYGYPRLGGIGVALARELGQRTGYETRVTVLGHVQRGGTPTEFDRVLATRYGYHAAELVDAGNFGRMVSLQGTEMTSVPLKWVEGVKTVDLKYLEMARIFF